ncbi:MAG: VCBS repeat-containing protein, partial [Myxococcales bacterium]|nr:VCBS repeat-containing protein [Myxococcales bacterium]
GGAAVSSRKRDCKDEVGSTASVRDGYLGVEHEGVAYVTQGARRAPRLVYQSAQADPRPVVVANVTIPSGVGVPEAISSRLRVGGVDVGARLYQDTAAIVGPDRTLRHGVQFDATTYETGLYPYSMLVTSHYPRTQISANQRGEVLVVNRAQSPWGAGWGLDGIANLVPIDGGGMLLVDGDGSTIRYRAVGAGAGAFAAPVSFGASEALYDVVVTDLDGDDHPDILGSDFNNHQAAIFWGDGTVGGFSAPDLYPLTTTQGTNAGVGDFDDDGRLDFAVTNFNGFAEGSFDVFLADGPRSFAPAVNYATGSNPIGIVARDMDDDGILDLVVANQADRTVSIFPGDGAGGFGTAVTTSTSSDGPRKLCIEDLNGDNRLDVVTVGLGGRVTTLVGIGGGRLVEVGVTASVGSSTYALACGDLNEDGILDVATANRGTNDMTYLFGDGSGGFVEQGRLAAGAQPHSVAVSDVDADGLLDVVVVSDNNTFAGPKRIAVYYNAGNGLLGQAVSFDTGVSETTSIQVADVNEDGAPDLVAGSRQSAGVTILAQETNVLQAVDAPPGDFSILIDHGDGTHTRRAKDGMTWDFDASGRIVAMADRNGNTTAYAYDGDGLLATITDPVGRATTFAFSGGLLDEITDPVGRMTTFDHDADGNLTRITDPDGTSRQFVYDDRHLLTRQIDKRSQSTFYSYDFADKVSRIDRPDGSVMELVSEQTAALVDPFGAVGTPGSPAPGVTPADAAARVVDGRGNTRRLATNAFGDLTDAEDALARSRTLERDTNGSPTRKVDEAGKETHYTYDDAGNLVSLENPAFATTTFEYDGTFAMMTKETDAAGRVTTYEYDAAGNLLKRTDPNGKERSYTYNAAGQRTSQTDEFMNTTVLAYDARGNLERVTNPLGDVIEFSRDDAGFVTGVTEGAGAPEARVSTLTYDAMNRPITQTFGNGATSTFGYDADGHITSVQVASGETATLSYDPLGRFETVDHPLRGMMEYEYDEVGNIAAVTDGGGDRATYVYDASNRIVETHWPDGGVESYAYNGPGDLTEVRDPLDQATTFTIDPRGRQTERTDPLGNLRQYSYDSLDRMNFTGVPSEGQQIQFTYDNRGRITRATSRRDGSTADPDVNFTYDDAGNMTRVYSSESDLRFTYDVMHRLVGVETVDMGHQPASMITYTYDAVGNRTTLTATPGGVTTYAYDGAGRATRVTPPFGGPIDLAYDPIGRAATIDFPNGVATDLVYDALGRLASIAHALGPVTFAAYTYEADDEGFFTSMTDDSGTRTFTYDARDRLVGAGTAGSPETYAYDLAGNRTASHRSASYLYDAANRLVEDAGFTYDYDADGKLASKTAKGSGVVTLYTYNGRNQLIRIDSTAGDLITYVYDGLARRIEKNVNGTVTRYVYDG